MLRDIGGGDSGRTDVGREQDSCILHFRRRLGGDLELLLESGHALGSLIARRRERAVSARVDVLALQTRASIDETSNTMAALPA